MAGCKEAQRRQRELGQGEALSEIVRILRVSLPEPGQVVPEGLLEALEHRLAEAISKLRK